MEVTLLTPFGLLFGLVALVPLAVFRRRERRASWVRAALDLDEPPRRSRGSVPFALVTVCGLLALAAAQPVVATARALEERTDAQVFIALDTSRSMLASAAPGEPTRFDRARAVAEELAEGLPEVPVGVASLTDRLLPHLFPTTDRRVLAATMRETLSVESPGPSRFYIAGSAPATTYDALAAVPTLNYFPPDTRKRVLVVLTDGETRPIHQELAAAFRQKPTVETVFVHFGDDAEQIYVTGVAEVGYVPDPASEVHLARAAKLVGGRVLAEDESDQLADVVGDVLGSGPTTEREHEGTRRPLMPWITLAAMFPLGFVLFRRNL